MTTVNNFVHVLLELKQVNKFPLKKEKRSTVVNINVDEKAYSGINRKDFIKIIAQRVSKDLTDTLAGFESERNMNYPGKKTVVIRLLKVQIRTPDGTFPVELEVLDPKVSSRKGHTYLLVVKNNVMKTLLITNANTDKEVAEQVRNHNIRMGEDSPVIVKNSAGWLRTYDIAELLGKSPEYDLPDAEVDERELPYETRTTYRKGQNFIHDEYGTGKIVNTSTGSHGEPNERGFLQWIDVDFDKPYVSGGKLKTVRRIKNVYSKIYWKNHK